MTSLHISHTVNDYADWLATFESFAEFRRQNGVSSLTLRRGVDDPNFVAVDLEFGSAEKARSFLQLLETQIWPGSPHLDGRPTSHILEQATASV